MKKLLDRVNKILTHLSGDHIDAFSAKASFFIVLSFFPFVMFILNVVKFFPLYDMLINTLSGGVFPKSVNDMLISVVNEISHKASGTMLSVSAVIVLWASSIGMLSVSRGLNVIYRKNETRNYFVLRAIACFNTLLLAVLLVLLLVFMVFGNSIAQLIIDAVPSLKSLTLVVLSLREIVTFIVLFIFFTFIYTVAPNGRNKIKHQLPGAAFTSILWILFSYVFSFYIDTYSNYSYIYGSLTAILLLMLWLYFCMYIMFIGAEINNYIYRVKD